MKRTLALILVCTACGSGSPTHVTASGGTTVFTGVEAFSVVLHETELSSEGGFEGGHPVTNVGIFVASIPGACARVAAKTIKRTTTNVDISVRQGTADAIATGTYSIRFPSIGDLTPTASVTALFVDGSCQLSPHPRQARSGTVTLSQISVSGVSGSIDVTLDDGAKLVGAFDAPHCAAAETPPALGDLPAACVE
jgi:hypothetical protein